MRSIQEYFSLAKLTVNASTDWLLPPKCLSCGQQLDRSNGPVCIECYLEFPQRYNTCFRCGQNYAALSAYCGRCLVSPPPYDACFCAFEYNEQIAHIIQKFKYFEQPELADHLAYLLFQEVKNFQIELPELFIPVPMHISKLRKRGFNQSLLLSRAISKLSNISYRADIVSKCKATPAQADLPKRLRRKNLKDSFKIKKKTKAKHIVIVDDVVTTGSTATEIAKILKRNGVNYVQVWGIAQKV